MRKISHFWMVETLLNCIQIYWEIIETIVDVDINWPNHFKILCSLSFLYLIFYKIPKVFTSFNFVDKPQSKLWIDSFFLLQIYMLFFNYLFYLMNFHNLKKIFSIALELWYLL